MTTDSTITAEANFTRRWLTVKRMKKILSHLKDDDIISPNRTGNLSVFRDSEQRMTGYIDFQTEQFETLDNGSKNKQP